MSTFHKYKYFSSFEVGNGEKIRVNNSAARRVKNLGDAGTFYVLCCKTFKLMTESDEIVCDK